MAVRDELDEARRLFEVDSAAPVPRRARLGVTIAVLAGSVAVLALAASALIAVIAPVARGAIDVWQVLSGL